MAKKKKPTTNKKLDGFDIKINSFGEVKSSLKIDEINKFLNKNVDDKKLRNRDGLGEVTDKE